MTSRWVECLEPNNAIYGIDPPAPRSCYDEYNGVEEELHRSEDVYKRLFKNSLGLICAHHIDGVRCGQPNVKYRSRVS